MKIGCRELSFTYRSERVLASLDWSPASPVELILGPNGAGKSTLLTILASVLRPERGEVLLNGRAQSYRRACLADWRRRVGWVPQQAVAVRGLTCAEQVAYAGWLKGIGRVDATKRASAALAMVGLAGKGAEPATSLSGGQRRRLGIACALVHDAEVVLLDEPMAGLDPAQRRRLTKLIQSMEDIQWVLSTHQTEDLLTLARSVSVLDHGRLQWSGTLDAFLARGQGESASEKCEDAYRKIVGEED